MHKFSCGHVGSKNKVVWKFKVFEINTVHSSTRETKNSLTFVINYLDKYGSFGSGSSSFGLKSGKHDMDISNKQHVHFFGLFLMPFISKF